MEEGGGGGEQFAVLKGFWIQLIGHSENVLT